MANGILSQVLGQTSGPTFFAVQIGGVPDLAVRFQKFPERLHEIVEKNYIVLGQHVAHLMRNALAPVKYTGETEASISSEIDVDALTLQVGPTAPQAAFVRTGTRPHWAPIGPLKKWAYWKLGDENAAYAVQRSIARYGTSMYLARRGIAGTEQTAYGVGLNFPRLVMEMPGFQVAVRNTARRLGTSLAASISSAGTKYGDEGLGI